MNWVVPSFRVVVANRSLVEERMILGSIDILIYTRKTKDFLVFLSFQIHFQIHLISARIATDDCQVIIMPILITDDLVDLNS